VLVAGIGFTLGRTEQAGQAGKDQLGDLVVDSIEAVWERRAQRLRLNTPPP
jgi:hypothetical protein